MSVASVRENADKLSLMTILCVLGLHRWTSHATARPGTTVHRCDRCGRRTHTHHGRDRLRKRALLVPALIVSAALWFVGYNLIFHGRTRVIHTMSRTANKVEVAASRGRAMIHRAQGDRGQYVQPED